MLLRYQPNLWCCDLLTFYLLDYITCDQKCNQDIRTMVGKSNPLTPIHTDTHIHISWARDNQTSRRKFWILFSPCPVWPKLAMKTSEPPFLCPVWPKLEAKRKFWILFSPCPVWPKMAMKTRWLPQLLCSDILITFLITGYIIQ